MNDSFSLMKSEMRLIILDCDGVLYPQTQLSMNHIQKAVAQACQEYGFSPELLQRASFDAKSQGHQGLFNYLVHICRLGNIKQEKLLTTLFNHIDYSLIQPNPQLLKQIRAVSKHIPVCVLTNNHKMHLERVFHRLFGLTTGESGVPCFDITSMYNGTYYLAKQTKEGLSVFCAKQNVQPYAACIYDDTPKIIESAVRIGMQARLVTRKAPLQAHLMCLQRSLITNRLRG